MRAEAIRPAEMTAAAIAGLVIAQDLPKPGGEKGYAFRKGHRLQADDLAALQAIERSVVHIVRPEANDIGEDEAGLRLARAVAGGGLELRGPSQSRVNLIAEQRGLLEIDSAALAEINAIDGMAVFTLFNETPVEQAEIVAGVKVAPLVIANASLSAAETRATAVPEGVVRVRPFRPARVCVLYREKLVAAARARFAEAIQRKVEWFGSTLAAVEAVSDEPTAIAGLLDSFCRAGADLIFTAGGSSADPLDATLQALELVGARLVRRGVPAHPGSMFWMAYRDQVPILSLASCSLFSQATIVDVVLPHLLVGRRLSLADLGAFGHGGLMEHGPVYRFPPYAGRAT